MSQRKCKCKDCEAARSLLAAHQDEVIRERAEMYRKYEQLLRQANFPEKSGSVEAGDDSMDRCEIKFTT